MKLPLKRRDLAMLLAGAAIASLLISPAGAHVGGTITHLWNHLKPKVTSLVYTKAQSDSKYLGKTAKAADADKLDGKNFTDFLATDGVAADSNKLDGKDSTDFAPVAEGWHIVGATGEPGFNAGDYQLYYDLHGFGPSGIPPGSYCTWENFDGNHQPAAFYKDADGQVHLDGLVNAVNGTSQNCGYTPLQDGLDNTIFRLPAGYRPDKRVVFSTMAFAQHMRIDVDPNGMVSIGTESEFVASGMELARNWVTLSGLSFPAEVLPS